MTLEGFKLRIASSVGIILSPTHEKMLDKLIGADDTLDFAIKSTPVLVMEATRQHNFFILHENGDLNKESYAWEDNFLGIFRFYDGERYRYIVAFPIKSI